MSFEYTEPADLDEAKLILSLKMDEIASLGNKLKMIEKRANIKVAQSNYKLEQEKSKVSDLDKKMERLKENVEMEKKKMELSEKELKDELNKLKEIVSEMGKSERNKEREFRAQLYEEGIKLEKEKEKIDSLKKQLKVIKKVFNPTAILEQTQKKSLEQLPSYTSLIHSLQSKQQQINSLTLSLQTFKSQTLSQIQESFSKLSSYEQVMQELAKRNQQLQLSMSQKEEQLEHKRRQVQSKMLEVEQVQGYAHEKMMELNEQILHLRKSMNNISMEESRTSIQPQEDQHLQFLFELQQEFQGKEQRYISRIQDLEEHITRLVNDLKIAESNFANEQSLHLQQFQKRKQEFSRLEKGINDKEEIIEMLRGNIKELEGELEIKKQEAERYMGEIAEMMKKKRKHEEEVVEKQEFWKLKEDSLLEEIQLLRARESDGDGYDGRNKMKRFDNNEQSQRKNSDNFVRRSFDNSPPNSPPPTRHRNSLLAELQAPSNTIFTSENSDMVGYREPEPQQPNWFQLYQNALRRHNKFIKEVYFYMQKVQEKIKQTKRR